MKNDLKEFCESNLKTFIDRGVINGNILLEHWNKFLKDSKETNWSRIWGIVVLEHWLKENNIE